MNIMYVVGMMYVVGIGKVLPCLLDFNVTASTRVYRYLKSTGGMSDEQDEQSHLHEPC